MILVWLRCRSGYGLDNLNADWGAGVDGLYSWSLVKTPGEYPSSEIVSQWRDEKAFESFTRAQGSTPPWSATVVNLTAQLHHFISWGGPGVLACTRHGTILDCRGCFLDYFGATQASLLGSSLWERLTEADVSLIQTKLDSQGQGEAPFLCNFVSISGRPFTLECSFQLQDEVFTMLCTLPRSPALAILVDELLELNNQLATKTREIARQNKALLTSKEELEQVYLQLQQSHWHIKKLQDCLPICLNCEKVKTGENHWEELLSYFRSHTDFISHGYCPQCQDGALRAWERGL